MAGTSGLQSTENSPEPFHWRGPHCHVLACSGALASRFELSDPRQVCRCLEKSTTSKPRPRLPTPIKPTPVMASSRHSPLPGDAPREGRPRSRSFTPRSQYSRTPSYDRARSPRRNGRDRSATRDLSRTPVRSRSPSRSRSRTRSRTRSRSYPRQRSWSRGRSDSRSLSPRPAVRSTKVSPISFAMCLPALSDAASPLRLSSSACPRMSTRSISVRSSDSTARLRIWTCPLAEQVRLAQSCLLAPPNMPCPQPVSTVAQPTSCTPPRPTPRTPLPTCTRPSSTAL